jgi:hypothetical protein
MSPRIQFTLIMIAWAILIIVAVKYGHGGTMVS